MTRQAAVSEDLRERIAKAIYAEGAFCGNCEYDGWGTCLDCQQTIYGYVRVALDAMDGAEATALRTRLDEVRAQLEQCRKRLE